MRTKERKVNKPPLRGLMFSFVRLNSLRIMRSTQASGSEVMISVARSRSLPLKL